VDPMEPDGSGAWSLICIHFPPQLLKKKIKIPWTQASVLLWGTGVLWTF